MVGLYEGLGSEWMKFVRDFRRNASLEDLQYTLSRMADYNSSKLYDVLFKRVCRNMESRGIDPCDDINKLNKMLRGEFLRVGKKVFNLYRWRQEGISLTFSKRGLGEICHIRQEPEFEDRNIESMKYEGRFIPQLFIHNGEDWIEFREREYLEKELVANYH